MKDLRDLSPREASEFGGKASGLARLIAAGARVPEGFAVEAGTASPDAWPEADRAEFLRRAEGLLRGGPLAVRSSALAEDSAQRSFAGLFETLLDIRTPQEALSAAARCVASGGAGRVLSYAGALSPLPVGIVVQALVPAARAGVCFTRDPAGRDTAVVIEAVAGAGDALVSGRSEPERWRSYFSGLGKWVCQPEGRPSVLDPAEAERIAARARSLETSLGAPLDLEWALDGEGGLWWLQARPITVLREPPHYEVRRSAEGVDDGPVTVWSNWNVRETMPDPLHPLTWSHWVESILPTLGHMLFGFRKGSPYIRQLYGLDQINGRIYFNMNAVKAIPVIGPIAVRTLESMDTRTNAAATVLEREGVLTRRRLPGSRISRDLSFLAASIRGLSRLRAGLLPGRALRRLERDGKACAAGPAPAELSGAELLRELHLFERPENFRVFFGLQMEIMALLAYRAGARAFRGHERALQLLATGIPANPTTQISLGVEELARAAIPLKELFSVSAGKEELLRRLGEVPGGPEWLGRLDDFLERFGHRGPMEFDLAAPRWREDPSMILALVRARLESPGREGVGARMARLGAERREAVEEAAAASPFYRRSYMRLMARMVELYMPLRESPKHYGMFAFDRIRRCAVELGNRLAQEGVIERPDDVFFLELGELQDLVPGRAPGGVREAIAERRERHERFLSQRAPDLLRSDGVPVLEESSLSDDGGSSLRGTPISAGRARGPVKLLDRPDPALVRDGDVLVMVFADPGWTPLFPRASALVMEVGGLMCHAAVVAREMGVPAVFGVRDATRLLHDGQEVQVDGAAGTVTVEDP